MNNFKLLFLAFFLIWSGRGFGQLSVSALSGDHMVLQRNSTVNLQGTAKPGETVTVTAGWNGVSCTGMAGDDGKWIVKVTTTDAGGPYEIHIQGNGESVTLRDVLLGEVWVCSGQSNLEFTFRMFGGWARYKAMQDDIARGKYNRVRMFTVAKNTSMAPLDTCQGSWITPDTATALDFSATAWFYGTSLHDQLDVPIGLVVTAWGGTPAEAWTPFEKLTDNPELAYYLSDPNKSEWFPTHPSVLFNAMIHPLLPLTFKGAIWYQGESNVPDNHLYHTLFSTMVGAWREAWGHGDFPFFYVQIAPFTYQKPVTGALLREAQLKSLDIPNSGMAVTMDIAGDVNDIHPPDKLNVGRRLALWAMANTYRGTGPAEEFSGPIYSGLKVEGKKLKLEFSHAESGLRLAKINQPGIFEVAGADRYFVPAKAKAEGSTLTVWSDYVKLPVAVRYAFRNESTAVLFNGAGLPASSFRSDNWPVVTETVRIRPVADVLRKSVAYSLFTEDKNAQIRYSTDNTEPMPVSPLYTGEPLAPEGNTTLTAKAFVDGNASVSISSWPVTVHKAIGKPVKYASLYADRYPAGGPLGLVDGLQGSDVFGDGNWQGFEGDDLEAVIDLGEVIPIKTIRLNFLSDPKSWIFLPRSVEIRISADGENYRPVERFDNFHALSNQASQAPKAIVPLRANCFERARYISIRARNLGTCPPGHPGAGSKAWMFTDEIIVD